MGNVKNGWELVVGRWVSGNGDVNGERRNVKGKRRNVNVKVNGRDTCTVTRHVTRLRARSVLRRCELFRVGLALASLAPLRCLRPTAAD